MFSSGCHLLKKKKIYINKLQILTASNHIFKYFIDSLMEQKVNKIVKK